MNFFQKWVVNTLRTEDVKDVLAKRLNELEPIKKDIAIRAFVHKSFKGYHAHRNPRRGNHDISRDDTE